VKSFFAVSFLLVESLLAVILVAVLLVFWNYSRSLPRVEALTTDVRPPKATQIVPQDGVVLASLEVENRIPVQLADVPSLARLATIAIEDHRFYEHHGVDVVGVARAAYANFRGHNMTRQGGSTLTQEVVRNLPQLGLGKQKQLARKVQEAVIALRMEQIYSKEDILQLYLNNVYYGGGAYGIQAAAKTFFGKPIDKLTLSETALLAGLPQRPTAFTPFEHRKEAIARRDEVLAAMEQYGYITHAQAERARKQWMHFAPKPVHRNFNFRAPYFTTWVLNGLVKRYGAEYVYSGLRIETTLSYSEQQAAERTLATGLERAEGRGANQGALVAIDPRNGYIRAMVGGRNFFHDQYNAVTQGRRQPGSTFKAFDYSAAFDQGKADLHSTFRDYPFPFPHDPEHRVVHNYEGDYTYHNIDCLSAIKHSINTVAVQVAHKVGIQTVIQYAHKMGITTELAPYLPTALGASAVRPLDLCSAYTVFPNHGNRFMPMAVVQVTDVDGNIIESHQPQEETGILKPDTVDQMDKAFEAVVKSGTGTLARGYSSSDVIEDARGKTGTTSDNRDAWFAGYTPTLTAVVWVASVHRHHHEITYAQMPGATGGVLCAPIWHNFMLAALPVQAKFNAAQTVATKPPAPHQEETGDEETPRHRPRRHDTANPTAPEAGPTNDDDLTDPAMDEDSPANANTPIPPPETAPPNERGPAAAPEEAQPAPAPAAPGADTGTRAAAPARPLVTVRPVLPSRPPQPARPAQPAPPPQQAAAPRRAAPTQSEYVTVTVCTDSGDLANRYCDVTRRIRVTRAQARRMHRCRLHRPPPGEMDQ